MKPKMILIRGLPGSGKTTLAHSLIGFITVEADQFMVDEVGRYKFDPDKLIDCHQMALTKACILLEEGCNIAVANTFTRQWEIQPYLDLAKKHGIKPQIIECQTNFGSIHNVPEEKIQAMKRRWEPVHAD